MLLKNKINTTYFSARYIGNISQSMLPIPYLEVQYLAKNENKKPYCCTKFDIYPVLTTYIYSSIMIYIISVTYSISYIESYTPHINQYYITAL